MSEIKIPKDEPVRILQETLVLVGDKVVWQKQSETILTEETPLIDEEPES